MVVLSEGGDRCLPDSESFPEACEIEGQGGFVAGCQPLSTILEKQRSVVKKLNNQNVNERRPVERGSALKYMASKSDC